MKGDTVNSRKRFFFLHFKLYCYIAVMKKIASSRFINIIYGNNLGMNGINTGL